MRFRPPEIEVELYKEGFGDADLLGRIKVGKGLSELVERTEDPLVIALDGQWGTGKTHFLKRWVGAHSLENGGKATTIYFDAFEHDYQNDPLVSLVSAISNRFPKTKEASIKQIQSNALKLLKPAAMIGLSVASFGATQALDELGDVIVEAATGEAKQAASKFWEKETGRQVAMDEFKASVAALTEVGHGKNRKQQALVFVIDELDRCRPDYALELMEVIKHFFSIPRVHFVLGINIDSLKNSVKARYGPEIDAQSYLQKFFSFQFNLPIFLGARGDTPTTRTFAANLAKQMQFDDEITKHLADTIRIVTDNHFVSLRHVQQIFSLFALSSDQCVTGQFQWEFTVAAATLVVAKVINPDLFSKLLDSTATESEIAHFFGVTRQNVYEKSGDAYNSKYDHERLMHYVIWLKIVGEQPSFSDLEIPQDLFRYQRLLENIPWKLYHEHLDVFRIGIGDQ